MELFEMIRRELRVAFSIKAQPVWFRVIKWTVFLMVFGSLWRTRRAWFWRLLPSAAIVGVVIHLIWRWKTDGWTRSWGG